jgi:hypothetical protein
MTRQWWFADCGSAAQQESRAEAITAGDSAVSHAKHDDAHMRATLIMLEPLHVIIRYSLPLVITTQLAATSVTIS